MGRKRVGPNLTPHPTQLRAREVRRFYERNFFEIYTKFLAFSGGFLFLFVSVHPLASYKGVYEISRNSCLPFFPSHFVLYLSFAFLLPSYWFQNEDFKCKGRRGVMLSAPMAVQITFSRLKRDDLFVVLTVKPDLIPIFDTYRWTLSWIIKESSFD